MKKVFLYIIISVVIIISLFSAWYNKRAKEIQEIKNFNNEFESYLGKPITGVDLTTVMNRALESNEQNKIEKDSKGAYKNNEKSSIQILVKPVKDGQTYLMEAFQIVGMTDFTNNFGSLTFQATKIEYHKNGRISKILFEVQD